MNDSPFLKAYKEISGTDVQPTRQESASPFRDAYESTNGVKLQTTPADVRNAESQLGSSDFNGWCQAFVEESTMGKRGTYPSAIDAWVKQQDKARPGLAGIMPGDPIYFSPNKSNRGFGHTGIYMGNGQFISATDNGVQENSLNDWQNMTGQQVLGYIPIERESN